MIHTGRQELSNNVFAAGLAYFVAAIVGFVMPRVIYETVGPVSLGLWDLGWSFLVYLSFSGIGLGSAIAHYLSTLNSSGTASSANRIIVTGAIGQLLFALLTTTLFIGGFTFIDQTDYLGSSEQSSEILSIGVLLGATIFWVLIGDIAQGILLSRHKSRLGEVINLCHDVVLALSMVASLISGFGIVGLALATCIVRIIAELVRFKFARDYVKSVERPLLFYSHQTLRTLVFYGIKSSAAVTQELIIHQTVRLTLFVSLGPAALAAFSRYATIARQINRLVDKLSIAIPTVASEHAANGEYDEINTLYLSSVRSGLFLTLPMLSVFCVFGDVIVKTWMGENFVVPQLAWLFSGACLLHVNYSLGNRILSGLNAHGRITLACLALSGLALMAIFLFWPPHRIDEYAGLILVVVIFSVQIPHAIFVSFRLRIPFRALLVQSYLRPCAINALLLLSLLAISNRVENEDLLVAYTLILIAAVIFTKVYWHFAFTPLAKQELRTLFQRT